ncbi:MAG: hypothetical protein L0Y44_08270 [Phycisphaerales bacterium]|nr:hypothetical protein [Phycisphaerales bacterium]
MTADDSQLGSSRPSSMNHCTTFFCLLAISVASTATPSPAYTSDLQRLAAQLIGSAIYKTMDEPLMVEALDGAVILAEEAVRLDPDNADIWRMELELALLAEREELKNRAVERLVQLDPLDESIRLMRLTWAIDRYRTVEERLAGYERMLTAENIERIGAAVASRLALDLAMLHRRQGNIERFSQRLSQALTLDPSNRNAAAIAAGFFQMNVKDAYGMAELLSNLMLADPTDIITQVALAQLLLEHGAYSGAERMYRLAASSARASHLPPANNLLADQAVAQWAIGDHQGALRTLQVRQEELDEAHRRRAALQAQEQDQELSMVELAKLKAPEDPNLATVAAVIHGQLQEGQAAASLERAIAAYQAVIDAIKQVSEPNPARLAQLNLEAAWVAIWLGGELDRAQAFFKAAGELQALSEQATVRFEGLMAYRRGELENAVGLLEPIAADDAPARLGLAMSYLGLGRKKDAAREFLAVNRAQPGSLIGIWASSRLTELLGQRVPLSDEASKLEDLIAAIPNTLDRCPLDSSLALTMRVIPRSLTVGPYEPVIFDIELTNTSRFPLALDRNGPIRPQVVIVPTVHSAGAPEMGELRPFVVNVGRRLRLMPREKVVIPVNLRNYHTAQAFNQVAVSGSMVKITALINFIIASNGALKPSLYGSEVESPLVRVDGERIDKQWISQTIAAAQDPRAPGNRERLVFLGLTVGPALPTEMAPEDRRLYDEARQAFNEAFAKLDTVTQAWMLSVIWGGDLRKIEGLSPSFSMARKSQDRLVRLAYLVFHSLGANDPMIDAALRGDDPAVSRLAQIIRTEAMRAAATQTPR